jgi:hypothetical protein
MAKPSFIWDYDVDEERFKELLSGLITIGHLDKHWAAVRLFEHAPYSEIVRLLGYRGIIRLWPEVRKSIRSHNRKRGLDFLVEWLPQHHPEIL